MENLPRWRLTSKHPAFYDTESGTSIEMTAKVYAAMQNLITEYNAFVDQIEKTIREFKAENREEMDCFKKCVTELVSDYIKTIDTKISFQDMKIDGAVNYMKDNLHDTTVNIINEAIRNGTLTVVEQYDPENESLDIVTTGGV